MMLYVKSYLIKFQLLKIFLCEFIVIRGITLESGIRRKFWICGYR
jgi:hypothetical protein